LEKKKKMKEFKLAQELILSNGAAVMTQNIKKALKASPVELARNYSNCGADLLFITDISYMDEEHEINISAAREIIENIDIPVILGGNIKRLEDVKKYLYAGASMTFLNMNLDWNRGMVKEASDRFGKNKIAVYASKASVSQSIEWKEQGAALIIKPAVEQTDKELALPVLYRGTGFQLEEDYHENAYGYCYPTKETVNLFYEIKMQAKEKNIPVLLPQSEILFSDLKKDENGLVPVVVQDCQTDEVLMLAYMNEEAFYHTINCGRMTYYSRSRQEQWEKGLTSGHFQYWKELKADCDYDTILARVNQIGAACHTGAHSCFFHEIAKKEQEAERNPNKVFENVMSVILARKEQPKEGSYTNYLFDKGIDKILKKCGEEAAEIIIAAKNQKPEETIYEISDFLYHLMVLMAEQGISWHDVTAELLRR